MFEVLSVQGEPFASRSTAPPGMDDENESLPYTGNYTENDPRRCYVLGEADACVRVSLLVIVSLITGALCLLRVIQAHCYKSRNYHHYFIYYGSVLLCLLCFIHWIYVSGAYFDFINSYIILVQMLVIAHFFSSWALRLLQQEKLLTYLVLPVIMVALLYFTASMVWALSTLDEISHECTRPQWLLFTSSQLVIVQIFLVMVIYIHSKLNKVVTTRTWRLSQKAQLWGLVGVYEFVSVVTFIYDLYLLITSDRDHDCYAFFTYDKAGKTIIYVLHKVIKYLLPQWAILIIFYPVKRKSLFNDANVEDTETLSWIDKPNYQSTFYQTSGETEVEDDEEKLLPMAINVHPSSLNAHRARSNYSKSATNTAAIFPRSTPLSPASYQTSPWLRTLPSQSVRSSTSGAPPPKPVGSSTPANRPPAKAHTEKNTSQP